MSDATSDLVLVHLEYLRKSVDETNRLLALQNGRVRTLENDVAVLKDRAAEAKAFGDEAKLTARRWGGGIAVLAATLHALVSVLSGQK